MVESYRPCIVIPVYKHGKPLHDVLRTIRSDSTIPIFIVDDGNDAVTGSDIAKAADSHAGTTLVVLGENRGKGGAVAAGLLRAAESGFTHAVQIDADGQHDVTILHRFLEVSRENPSAMVGCTPVFDESVPSSRKNGRKVTTVWVAIETLSTDIKDAMCGFRVYPLASTIPLVSRWRLGRRMTFDIEIVVRLHWRGVPLVFIPTHVVYPEGAVSNFRMIRDNIAIVGMHTCLFFGMVARLPILLYRKLF